MAFFLRSKLISPVLALPLLAGVTAAAQQAALPRIDRGGVHPALLVDGKPFLLLGAQVNNSSAWPDSLPTVWPVLEELHANTVEAPVYWETLEPTEGQFDFTQIDALLEGAREHDKRLVLLWFGTWKNGSPGYVPEWVKRDPKRFPLTAKPDGSLLFSLSPFGEQTLHADQAAFAALMRHLRTADPQHTIILVQVENETGLWGAQRDHSATADKAFAEPVPREVMAAMSASGPKAGSWAEVFGPQADEFFGAWAIARYVEQVAAAGKRELPLPLYANTAVRDPLNPSGGFESGGPTYDVLPLWHAVAPSLDGLEPDIYMPEYAKVSAILHQYNLHWNAYFVPEIGNSPAYARFFFAALGEGAFGFSPFGMDRTGYSNYPLGAKAVDADTVAPFALNYAIAAPMADQLATWIQQGRVHGVSEGTETHSEAVDLSNPGVAPSRWKATVSYGQPSFYTDKPAPGNARPEGEALIVTLGPDEFLVSGVHCRIDFQPLSDTPARGTQRMWLSVEEGTFQDGVWHRARLWNGDQTDYGLNFVAQPQTLRVRLLAY